MYFDHTYNNIMYNIYDDYQEHNGEQISNISRLMDMIIITYYIETRGIRAAMRKYTVPTVPGYLTWAGYTICIRKSLQKR